MKKIKFLSVLLSCILLISFSYSCGSNETPDVSSVEESKTEESSESEETAVDVEIFIGEYSFNAKVMNTDDLTNDIVIYDKSFSSLYISGDHTGRFVASIKLKCENGGDSYSVNAVYDDVNKESKIPIPVNGFVVSIAASALPEGFRCTTSTKVDASGFVYTYERLDLATVMAESKSLTRRINMFYPDDGKVLENKIYFVSEKSFTIPDNSFFIQLKSKNSFQYAFLASYEAGDNVESASGLLFTGDYNIRYAKEFFMSKELKILTDNLNDLTDSAAVSLDGENYIVIPEENINAKSTDDGVYLYTYLNDSLVDNCKGDYKNIVVIDDTVVFVGEDNTSYVIPGSNGYMLCFVGDKKTLSDNIKLGDGIKNLLIDTKSSLPDKYVRIDGIEYEILNVNTTLSESNNAVIYSSDYGKNTGNEAGSVEIAFSDKKVISVTTEGNAAIPENGYVLSLKKGNKKYSSATKVKSGEKVFISFSSNDYSYNSFKYTAVGGTRMENYIVIYNNGNTKTGTNQYGVEFSVNSEGIITSCDYAGNMLVPTGGFVVSAHGDNIETLENAMVIGGKCTYDTKTKTVYIQNTPDSALSTTESLLNTRHEAYLKAKSEYQSLDYESLDKFFDSLYSLLDDNNADKESAVIRCGFVNDILDNMQFKMYESLAVENRCAWYRSNEKSDEEVENTLSLMYKMGLNSLYIETWYDGTFIGYSDHPLIKHTSVHGNYDVLEGFCRLSKKYDIEIHVWVENFFVGTQGNYLADNTSEHHLLDWNGKDYQPTMYGNFVFLNPLDEFSRDLVLGLYKEIITKYDIDGINLDYIRFPGKGVDDAEFGYNDDIIAAFKAETGITQNPKTFAAGSANFSKWTQFRTDIINNWVKTVYDMVQELDPSICISCAVHPSYPTTGTGLCQDFANWVQNGWIDEVFSMSYCSDLVTPIATMRTFLKKSDGKAFFTIGLSAFETSPDYILVGQINLAREYGTFGSNLFSWGSLINHEENYYDALISSIWSSRAVRTDGGSETVKAYCERLLTDIESVYKYLTPIEGSFYSDVASKAKSILDSADNFDFSASGITEKSSYIESALEQLEGLYDIMYSCSDDGVKSAMISDLEYIIRCLKLTRR